MAYRKYIFSIAIIALMLNLFSGEARAKMQSSTSGYDSVELSADSIYICNEHYFEWCKEQAVCAYCGEALVKTDLWSYYKLLECEDCQKFFDDHYEQFKSAR